MPPRLPSIGVRGFRIALTGLALLLASAPTRAQGAAPAGPVLFGAGNVPISLAGGSLAQRFDDVDALGLSVIRAQTGGSAYEGRRGRLALAERLLTEARERGIRVIFGVHRNGNDFRGRTDPAAVREAGAAWGRLAARFPGTVYGFSVQREIDHFPEDLRARAVEVVFAFCEGVRSEAPEVICIPGGLGYRPGELSQSGEVLRQLAPGIRSGLFAGVNLHYYRPCRYALHDAIGGRTERNVNALLDAADLPRDTPLFFTEVNVRSTSCDSEPERAQALGRLLRVLAGYPTTRLILIHTPWGGKRFGVPPGTLAGDAILGVTRD